MSFWELYRSNYCRHHAYCLAAHSSWLIAGNRSTHFKTGSYMCKIQNNNYQKQKTTEILHLFLMLSSKANSRQYPKPRAWLSKN